MLNKRYLPGALLLWMLAGVVYFWVAPRFEELPENYAAEIRYETLSKFRSTPNAAWETLKLTGRRVDQTLISDPEHSIIQADLHWTDDKGLVAYKNSGIYGVDRRTRMNLPGYGNVSRTGLFVFPQHMAPTNYSYWDPNFQGERVATFERADNLDGLAVYVFRFAVSRLDESEGYNQLPGVPDRYKALTDATGTLWIEPVSGSIVDYEEQGESFFAEPDTGKRVAGIYVWKAQYAPPTKAAKIAEAIEARRYIHALEAWLPAGLLAAGALWLTPGWRRFARAGRRTANRDRNKP
jgi:uncharacterized protein YuzE